MSLFYYTARIPSALIYVWKIEEEHNFFIQNMPWHQTQLEWLDSIHPLKKLEYLASRFLIYKVTGKLDSHLYKDTIQRYGHLCECISISQMPVSLILMVTYCSIQMEST